MKRILLIVFLFTFSLGVFSCGELLKDMQKLTIDSWLSGWIQFPKSNSNKKNTEKQTEKQIKELEKQTEKYEKAISKKISSAKSASFVYYRLGRAYANMGAFSLCVENIKRAVSLGYENADILYEFGVCQANLARQNNWQKKLTNNAESTFLTLLQKYPSYEKAYYPLSLLYFYGFSGVNYRLLYGEKVYSKTFFFQEKGFALMQRYNKKFISDIESYFALAHMSIIMNKEKDAKKSMDALIVYLQNQHPKNYQKQESYKRIIENYGYFYK